MPESFTEEEKAILKTYCSNTDKDIFVLMNLPESIKGALFSRYSRAAKSLRRLLLDEFIGDTASGFKEMTTENVSSDALRVAVKKAEAFYERILDGYGDDSVGELGGAHLAVENVSQIGAKVLEDCRIGGSPLEKSTRYVAFNQKVDGDYMYYKEPVLMQSEFKELYLSTMQLLFDTYTDLYDKMHEHLQEINPLESFQFFDIAQKKEIPFTEITDEKLLKRARIAYKSSMRAKVCDVLRYLLPCATFTNIGIFGNGRFFQDMLKKLYSHPVKEMQDLGKSIHEELDTVIPSFVRRAKFNEYVHDTEVEMQATVTTLPSSLPDSSSWVDLVDFDAEAENKVLALMLYTYSHESLQQLREKVSQMTDEEKKKLIQDYIGKRKIRRDKPFRALEQTYYEFDILADFGAYRDLQRHRILTQMRQLLSTLHGYDVPQEILDAGFETEYKKAMDAAKDAYEKIVSKHPREAQYLVPLGYKIRWMMKMNLREALHFIELRSGQQGHPSYRKIAQEMFYKIKEVHPVFADYMQFVDLNEYKLERIGAEMRKQEKREQRESQ